MTPEGHLKKQVQDFLKTLGPACWYFCPMTHGYGRSGIPDFVGCYHGNFFSIETKAEGKNVTPWQAKEGQAIYKANGRHIVAYALEPVKNFMSTIYAL